jgi:UDP-3-O-[3-hydroxymyristoyl] glucosamine N-acyltransferase
MRKTEPNPRSKPTPADGGITLAELARLLGGELCGAGGIRVSRVSPLPEAGPDALSFAVDARYFPAARASAAGALLLPSKLPDLDRPQIVVKNLYLALARALRIFFPEPELVPGISPSAVVSDSALLGVGVKIHPLVAVGAGAKIGARSEIYPNCYIGPGVVIGEECRIYSRVSLREGTRIGNRVIIQDGAVIGSDGFGYARDGEEYKKIPQVGIVEIEDEVEIGANVTVDRATLGRTIIRRGTKIDNLVQVAHNVEIGKNAIIVAQVAIGGSCRIGDQAVLAGQVAVADHVEIGAGAQVGGQSGVLRDVPPGAKVSGTYAMPLSDWLRVQAILPKLPEMRKELQAIRARLSRGEKKGRVRSPNGPKRIKSKMKSRGRGKI